MRLTRLVVPLLSTSGIVMLYQSYTSMFTATPKPDATMGLIWALVAVIGLLTFSVSLEFLRHEIAGKVAAGTRFHWAQRAQFGVIAALMLALAAVFGFAAYRVTIELQSWPHGVVGSCLFGGLSRAFVFYGRLAARGRD